MQQTLIPDSEKLKDLAAKYVWWTPAERTVRDNLQGLVAQVMELGSWRDAVWLMRNLGKEAFKAVLQAPPPGLSRKSWLFWHYRLGVTPGENAPKRRMIG
ncbi:MAG: hypothetical protein HQL45_06310 [Alphaproteobacteria bacterium]|nr:hypothetical protein [Alphaproteobacteria bacterium]